MDWDELTPLIMAAKKLQAFSLSDHCATAFAMMAAGKTRDELQDMFIIPRQFQEPTTKQAIVYGEIVFVEYSYVLDQNVIFTDEANFTLLWQK